MATKGVICIVCPFTWNALIKEVERLETGSEELLEWIFIKDTD